MTRFILTVTAERFHCSARYRFTMIKISKPGVAAEEVAVTPSMARENDTLDWPTLYVKKDGVASLYLRIDSPGPGVSIAVKELLEAVEMVGIDLRRDLLF